LDHDLFGQRILEAGFELVPKIRYFVRKHSLAFSAPDPADRIDVAFPSSAFSPVLRRSQK